MGPVHARLIGNPRVTYAPGDLSVSGGSASGLLIVDGRLHITGPFMFSGLIIARGGVETSGSGTTISGALLSFAPSNPGVQLRGVTLQFAPCAVLRALESAISPRPVRERSWAELY